MDNTYRVLYRKYRPRTFADVTGQEHITKTLSSQVHEHRLSHAYLFTGSRGIGKTTCAKILAKAVNCPNEKNGDPCNECEICKGIDSGSILDVVEIDAASNRGIDDIRALREESAFTPAQTKYRVYIIDEVHMLTIEAFNALLKTLEEPPEHVIFILATTEVQKLPSTILSRCQRFDFRRLSIEDLSSRLKYVSKNENVSLSDDAAVLISRISDGGMRDALSLLDRCVAISNNITADVVSDAAGMMNKSYLFKMSEAFVSRDVALALNLIDEMHKAASDTERLCSELIDHFRNLLIVKTVKNSENILACTDDEYSRLVSLSKQFSRENIMYIMDTLEDCGVKLKQTQNRRVEMELAVIKICSPSINSDNSALLERISSLEKQVERLMTTDRIVPVEPITTEKSTADTDVKNIALQDFDVKKEPLQTNESGIDNDDEPNLYDDSLDGIQFDDDLDELDGFVFDEPPATADDCTVVFDFPEENADNQSNDENAELLYDKFVSCLLNEKNGGMFKSILAKASHTVLGDNITITCNSLIFSNALKKDDIYAKIENTASNIFGRKMNIKILP